jgi:hypothetical protein
MRLVVMSPQITLAPALPGVPDQICSVMPRIGELVMGTSVT